MKWLGIMFMAVLLAIAPGYGSAQPQKDTPPAAQTPEVKGEPAAAAKSFTAAERKDYEKKTAEELAAIQDKIAGLRVQATSGAPQQKRTLILAANNLQFQKVAAGNRLTALEKAPEAAWGQQKAELDKAMEQLRKSCENAGIQLK